MSNHNFGTNWFKSVPVTGQTPFREGPRQVWNRTGGALTQYGIYAFDLALQVTAEASANSHGITLPAVANYKWGSPFDERASAWNNIRAVPASGISVARMHSLVFCVAQLATADNELADVVVIGETSVNLIGVASQAYTGGWGFQPTVGQTYGTYSEYVATAADANAAAALAAGYSIRRVGIALAAKTEAGTPAATAVNSFFNGFGL